MAKYEDIPKFGVCQGIKVITNAPSVAGPFAASLFADNGASVISIENPDIPEMSRNQFGNTYQMMWRNHRCLTLNIPSPEGREVFLKLLKEADVFIEASSAVRSAQNLVMPSSNRSPASVFR
jgi:L-carnitine CoA-transferase